MVRSQDLQLVRELFESDDRDGGVSDTPSTSEAMSGGQGVGVVGSQPVGEQLIEGGDRARRASGPALPVRE